MPRPVVASPEEQKLKFGSDYQEMLSEHGLVDPMLITKNKRIDNMTRWPINAKSPSQYPKSWPKGNSSPKSVISGYFMKISFQ